MAAAVPYTQMPKGLLGEDIEVWVRRDDLIHPLITGNKFYKLYFNLMAAASENKTIVSAGGAYSNHIHALARAGFEFGLSTVGIIRGERPAKLSPTLSDAEDWGMKLVFVPRSSYKPGDETWMLQFVDERSNRVLYIPEGGDNEAGFKGTQLLGEMIGKTLPRKCDTIALASGTGNTLAGLVSGLSQSDSQVDARIMGFSVLKGNESLVPQVCRRLSSKSNTEDDLSQTRDWSICSGYHLGGYGKKLPSHLNVFMNEIEKNTDIRLDPVYTVKLFWGVRALATQGYWRKGSKLLLVHTGGLQGCRGFADNLPAAVI